MKHHLLRVAILSVAVASVGSVGCDAPHANVPVGYTVEKERRIDMPFEAVWQRAVEWFATHNTPIKNLDKGSGLIATEYSLSPGTESSYADCGVGSTDMQGKVELTEPRGNFNLLVKPLGEGSTSVTVNAFWSCLVNTYRYEGFLSTNLVLISSLRTDCPSKGVLEKEILDYLTQSPAASASTAAAASPASPPPAPPSTGSAVEPTAPAQCTADTDCRAGRICRNGACAYPGCSKDVDCPPEQICERSACVPAPTSLPRPCEKDTQCPGAEVCVDRVCSTPSAPAR